MRATPGATIRRQVRPRRTGTALVGWGLRHPLRLLRRYGFGCFQFALLVVPVLLIIWFVVDLGDLAALLLP
ncbi:hypothetical protein AB0I51_05665 [Streptomyces sp. NPDC050549]|uniref:hypothetical protein n=1 Tax=Streptomyces sp. NPDC050549 TaxID=3155406 RepID=UPI00343A839D